MRSGIRAGAALAAALALPLLAAGVADAEPLPVPTNVFDGVAYENLHPGQSLPGSNDFDCVPTPEHPNPVILLHDLGATRQSNWAVYVPALKNEGYCVFALTYGIDPALTLPGGVQMGGLTTMEPAAEELAGFVDRVRYVNISTRYMQDYLGYPPAGENVTDIVVQDGCETDYSEQDALGASPRAVALTLNALDPEHPRPVPCGTILPGVGTMID